MDDALFSIVVERLRIKFETFPGCSMDVTCDFSEFTKNQWIQLHQLIVQYTVTTIEVPDVFFSKFKPETWGSLFNACRKTHIDELIFDHIILPEIEQNFWFSFFSNMKSCSIHKLAFRGSNFNSMSTSNLHDFFLSAATVISELTIATEDFSNSSDKGWSPGFLTSCLDILINTRTIQSFTFENDDWIGFAETDFWKNLTTKLPELSISHFGINSVGLHNLPPNVWFTFCSAMNKSISSLSLKDNKIYKFSNEQLAELFSGLIQTNINKLDIREYHPLDFSDERFNIFCDGIKNTAIKDLIYDAQQFTKSQKETISEILHGKHEYTIFNDENINTSNYIVDPQEKRQIKFK